MFHDMVAGVLWWIQCSVTWWQMFSGRYNVPCHGGRHSLVDTMFRDMVAGVLC